ncbi:MAG: hypothetical protein Q7R47_05920 [Candidatus Diapherotrites archaeon]|nr:hypothetical protein [Candidatus Diapherotrites archaeon]
MGPASEFRIQNVFQITGVGIVLVGQLIQGTLSEGQKGTVNGRQIQIKSIEKNHERHPTYSGLDAVGVNITGIQKNELKSGDILRLDG